MTDIVIIGSGHVANVMGRKFLASGHRVVQVVARNKQKGTTLAQLLNASYSPDFTAARQDAFLCLVAISDDALPELHRHLSLGRTLVAHTAGSVPASVLEHVSRNYGVLYPMQTFRAETERIPEFPLLVDGNTPETRTMLMDFAASVSSSVVHANDGYRRKMHLAAVATGNFSNHLYALVQDYCIKEKVNFDLLLPMLREIIGKLEYGEAARNQTGPAIRNDVQTLNAHRTMLADHPELAGIYDVMSDSIYRYHRQSGK